MVLTQITIEGFHSVRKKTYNLNSLNYFVGKNGAGKSTILQAIQLALLGYIPGTKKTKEAIFAHANGDSMAVTLYLDDSGNKVSIRRSWIRTSSGIVSDVVTVPAYLDLTAMLGELELPIFNFNQFIGMTANQLKDWFISFLPAANVEIDWAAELAGSIEDKGIKVEPRFISSVVDEIKELNQSGVEEIRAANTYFKQHVSFARSQQDKLQSTVSSLIYYDDIDALWNEESISAELAKARADQLKVQVYRKAQEDKKRSDAILAKYSDLDVEFESDRSVVALRDKASALIDSQAQWTAELDDCEHELKDSRTELEKFNAIRQSNGICPYTAAVCESIRAYIEDESRLANVAKLEREIEKLESRMHMIQLERSKVGTEYDKVCEDLHHLEQRYRERDAALAVQVELPILDDYSILDVDFDEYIHRLEGIQQKVLSNKSYNQLIDTILCDKYEVEQELAAYKAWEVLTGVNGLQTKVAAALPIEDFAKSMEQKYVSMLKLPEGVESVKFNIENKANSFSFGIVRNDHYIPFDLLSSGERCIFTLALLLSIVEYSSSPIKLVLVDDMFDHLDAVNIESVFESLYFIHDIQMVFAGVYKLQLPSAHEFTLVI